MVYSTYTVIIFIKNIRDSSGQTGIPLIFYWKIAKIMKKISVVAVGETVIMWKKGCSFT
jgi:hypothetical protein